MSDQTSTKNGRRGGLSVLGIGAAACVACCIGPIVAFLSGLGVLGVASTPFVGALGLIVAIAAVAGVIVIRRRRTPSCAVPVGPVVVEAPMRRRVEA